MSNNIINNVPYLRTQRTFPEELHELCVQLDKSYIDTANAINARTIGLYPTNKAAATGETFFLGTKKQQALRKAFTLTSTSAAIDHGIDVEQLDRFSNCWGTYTDGNKWYGFIFGNVGTTIAGQISFDITATQIEFGIDAGAPTLTEGLIVLSWIADP